MSIQPTTNGPMFEELPNHAICFSTKGVDVTRPGNDGNMTRTMRHRNANHPVGQKHR